jgi:hypothetical protein
MKSISQIAKNIIRIIGEENLPSNLSLHEVLKIKGNELLQPIFQSIRSEYHFPILLSVWSQVKLKKDISDKLKSQMFGFTIFNLEDNPTVGCDECYGNGSNDCSECSGQGEIECYNCDGYTTTDCKECNGDGETECNTCDGDGIDPSDDDGEESCSDCGGSGKEECTDCEGKGKVECITCDGDGSLRCEECYGDGSFECSYCDGDGNVTNEDVIETRIVTYISFDKKLLSMIQNNISSDETYFKLDGEFISTMNHSISKGKTIELHETEEEFSSDGVRDVYTSYFGELELEPTVESNTIYGHNNEYVRWWLDEIGDLPRDF